MSNRFGLQKKSKFELVNKLDATPKPRSKKQCRFYGEYKDLSQLREND